MNYSLQDAMDVVQGTFGFWGNKFIIMFKNKNKKFNNTIIFKNVKIIIIIILILLKIKYYIYIYIYNNLLT